MTFKVKDGLVLGQNLILDSSGNLTLPGKLALPNPSASAASINIGVGTTPTSPLTGDLWSVGAELQFRLTSTTKSVAFTDSALSGGSINNTPIGGTTRSTGAFTTLTANAATTLTAGTASTSTTTGTLVVTGGIGASGTVNAASFTGPLSGNATTATTLQTSRTINGVSFNGSANITITSNTTNTLTRGTYLTGSNFNGSAATTWAVDATTTNTASKVVARDASGNFSAGTITADLTGTATNATNAFNVNYQNDSTTNATFYPVFTSGTGFLAPKVATTKLTFNPSTGNLTTTTFTGGLSGNATTATTLQTARTINGVSFNGSANISINLNNSLTPGSYINGSAFNGSSAQTWNINATTASTINTIAARDASGDINVRLVRSEFNDQGSITGAIAFRTNNTTDNYVRFCNDVSVIRTYLDVPTRGGANATGTWGISISGNAATASNTSSISSAVGSSYTWTGVQNFSSANNTAFAGQAGNLTATSSTASGPATMSFHRTSAFAINMGLDTDNIFRIGGWSASSNRLQMDMSGNLTMAGNVTAFSDIRLKKDLVIIDNALDKVSKLNGYTYTRIDSGERQAGLVAQELLEILPESVQVNSDGTLSVAYGNLAGLFVQAIKELRAEIEELKRGK